MQYLTDPLLEINEYGDILRSLRNSALPVSMTGPSESQKVHIAASICHHLDCRGIFLAFNEMQARRAFDDFCFFYGDRVLYFPSKEIMLHDVEAKSYDIIFQRINAIDRFIGGDYRVAVIPAESVIQKLIPHELFTANILTFAPGEKVDLAALVRRLTPAGYERVDVVEGKGQFAIRGGIIDIFPVNCDSGARIELFDDEIDSIRTFDILSQRSVDRLEKIKILPAREVIYPEEKCRSIVKSIENDLEEHIKKIKNSSTSEHVRQLRSRISSDIEKLKNDYYFPGMDRLIPYIADRPSSILEYAGIHEGVQVLFVDEPQKFNQRVENVLFEYHEQCRNLLEKAQILPGSMKIYFDPWEIEVEINKKNKVFLNTLPSDNRMSAGSLNFSMPSKLAGSYQGHMDVLFDDIRHWKEKGSRVMILSGTGGRGERLSDTLRQKGIESAYIENVISPLQQGQVVITHGSLNKGFEYPSIGLVVVSDNEVFGREKRSRKFAGRKDGSRIKTFTDLNIGDYVVHQTHGIGQYAGIQKLAVENVKRDYLKIRYQNGDYLYIPTTQLEIIQKYIGTEGRNPKLNKLGGSDWLKTKKRVKESLKELAAELVRLYAQRQSVKGFAFSKDVVWQKQFEELFPYEETDDQLKCVEEIKRDMESDRPMDRLLCGDVGYGKTEVAIRAIFKAVMDGKQIAYLVPTTILAQQHYGNFKTRFKEFPVTVDVMSRFRSKAEQMRILKELKAGNVDILVGTHRLLQKDIHFKDLGMLVVDEEHRFGVSHKEKIKNIKPNIDVLTLTATPIPRTLHMSLAGIRDISTIEDPPEERYPVQTYVMEYNPDVIRDAIIRELSRKGQVFYLFNRVRSIWIKASQLQELVPDARIAVAHGQMDERELENIMIDFVNGQYDILVCTTIIESGLDMPNVNTIIVEDADKMGLAQLYQLRGRVGRSNRQAYAYITYKRDKILHEIAEKRLQAIKEFTEFGSGFKIAMRDLEIRGAGNLLGPEQHGHMEAVGYDMYCRLLNEAVKELKGEPAQAEEEEMAIDINISAYIDDDYINTEEQKIEMYKKIASIQDENDVKDIEDELLDRYGDLPAPVRNLLTVAHVKALAKESGFSSISEKNGAIIFQFRGNKTPVADVIGILGARYKRQLLFNAGKNPYLTYKIIGVDRENLLNNIKILLQDIKSFAV